MSAPDAFDDVAQTRMARAFRPVAQLLDQMSPLRACAHCLLRRASFSEQEFNMNGPSIILTAGTLALTAGLALADAPKSASLLEFGPDNTLFVADQLSGAIHAFTLSQRGKPPEQDAAFNLLDLDPLVNDVLGATGRLVYGDLAVHPFTRDAYVSVTGMIDGVETVAIVSIARDGTVERIDLDALASTRFELEDTADADVTFWRDIPAATLTVTDLDYANGELFVSGVSTGEFASTLRRVPFPFAATASSSSIEIYHAAHNQNETRAPIRAMTVVDLDGVATAVAAYTCTPLVKIPIDALADGAHVTGKTIAELGYGNTPLDVISFDAADPQGNVSKYVLVVNREMDADLVTLSDLTGAAAGPGLSEPVPYLGATSGVQTTPLPLSGVLHVADQDAQFLLALRRDLDTGAMDLVSFRKGSFFRVSDFISEYNFPDYAYADDPMSAGCACSRTCSRRTRVFRGKFVNEVATMRGRCCVLCLRNSCAGGMPGCNRR
ncbi:MAG: hypothetical protein AAFZ99_04445 [Pseudomonadota bacterium]